MARKQLTQAELEAEKKYAPTLPKQVRDQLEAYEAMTAQPAAPEGQTPEGEVAPPVQPATPEPANGNAAKPAETPAAPPPSQPAAGEDTWEQRARSMQGRLEQSLQANMALNSRIQTLENSIATLKAQGAAEPAPAPAPAPVKLVTDEEARDFGDDFLNVVGKRSREVMGPEFELLASRLAKVEGRVEAAGTVIAKNATEGLYDALARAVPNWKELNYDQGFKDWLAQPDPFAGRLRRDMLQEAFSGHEANRVINFFRGYTEATGLPQTPQANGPSAPPLAAPGNGSGKTPLEAYAAPGRARSAPQELPPDKPVYTNAWIARFMADKLAGKYRGREVDANAIEQDIYQAQHEGRIVP